MLLAYVPGGFEGYFDDASPRRREPRALNDGRLDAIGRPYRMRVSAAEE